MTTWVLILWASASYYTGSLGTVPGYQTLAECETAAEAAHINRGGFAMSVWCIPGPTITVPPETGQ